MPEVRLIDANALLADLKATIKSVREWKEEAQDEEIKIRADQAFGTFIECALRVKNAPTIEAEQVQHGRWIKLPESCQADYECSECGAGIGKIKPPYCALCGAKMDLRTPTEVQLDEADNVMMGGADNG